MAKPSQLNRTRVTVVAPRTPLPSLLYSRFFQNYPDWNYARVLGLQQERLFVTQLSMQRYARPELPEQEAIWHWLQGATGRRLSFDRLAKARIKWIRIGNNQISTTFSGVVSGSARLQETIELLSLLAADERGITSEIIGSPHYSWIAGRP